MEPVYVQLEKFKRGQITRREYLKRLVALGVATPAIIAYLDGSASAQDAPITPEFPAQDVIDGEPIVFRGWAYEPTVVEDNVRIFEEQYTENVDYQTVSGDYDLIIDTMQINNETLDMFYGHEIGIGRYILQDKLLDYSSWWDFERAKAEMLPAFLEAWTWRGDGKLYGLPYFSSIRGTIMVNTALTEKAGIDQVQLTTWDDFYDLCRQMKADGVVEYPLLNHWFATGWATAWQFLWECQNRGIALFDFEDAYRPLFNGEHESARVLEIWAGLFADGIHPESSFNMSEGGYVDGFATGDYMFSPQQTYDGKRLNDPALSQIAGLVDFATPPEGAPWGKIEQGGYLLPKRDRDNERLSRVFRHNGFFGYRDINDELFVAKRWAIDHALNSSYPAILEDPEVLAAYEQWMPGGERQFNDMGTYFTQAEWNPFHQCPWFLEWQLIAKEELEAAILGDTAPQDAMDNLYSGTNELYERYRDAILAG
jgi:multiple sugar transport system substrate-binding protein